MRATVQELLTGRDNNFNLVRFIAALAVVYDHSFMIPHGKSVPWLLPNVMSGDFGWYAVNVFFVLSGFLVMKSWLSRQDIISFAVARSMRLFPALSFNAFLVAFVVGPIVCLCLLTDYLFDARTWLYVPMTASLISPSQVLPFVFDTMPVKAVVNSPLWTLRYEAFSYAILAGLGVLGMFATRKRALATIAVFFSAYLTITLLTDLRDQSAFLDSLVRFWLCFFLGVSAYLVRERLTLRATVATALLLGAILVYGTPFYELMLQIALAYGVFWVVLVPDGAIRRFNELGDYSYGVYIFAWPLQQSAVLVAPDLSPHQLFVLVTPVIVLMAALSWHWIEHPALAASRAVTDWGIRHQQRMLAGRSGAHRGL
jgi:peptidoglycan/LPS O-acetylase OafA/YrhL